MVNTRRAMILSTPGLKLLMSTRTAFLGPAGTYGEQAAASLLALEAIASPELVPCVALRAVVQHLASGDCDVAVVPVENSVEGGVTATLDALWAHPELCIRRALVLPIRMRCSAMAR